MSNMMSADAVVEVLATLENASVQVWLDGGSAANFILADKHGREIDVHPIEFDPRGYGSFALSDGRRWPFPPAAFAGQGRVGHLRVRCLSADAQVQCHGQGYKCLSIFAGNETATASPPNSPLEWTRQKRRPRFRNTAWARSCWCGQPPRSPWRFLDGLWPPRWRSGQTIRCSYGLPY